MTAPGLGRLGFVGAGAVGTTLARALHASGRPVVAVASRTPASARRLAAQVPGCVALETAQQVADAAQTLLLTVPDDAIESVAGGLRLGPGQTLLHCSGAVSLEPLAAAGARGARVGGFHPLQTFAEPEEALAALPGTAFAVEAAPPLARELEVLARELGGWAFPLSAEDRPLYHASAVMACGLLVALVNAAAELWSGFGAKGTGNPQEGLRALLPLVRTTVGVLARLGPEGALTGPMARGDTVTVALHLRGLAARDTGALHLYSTLALAALPLARAKGGLAPEREEELEWLLRRHLDPLVQSQGPG